VVPLDPAEPELPAVPVVPLDPAEPELPPSPLSPVRAKVRTYI
jgi:hypothetical protein